MKNARDTLKAVTTSLPQLAAMQATSARRGTIAAISGQIRSVAEGATREEIEQVIAEERAVLDIDTALIDDTPWRDRQELSTEDRDFHLLIESIRQHGQISPIALRRIDDRYQIVFGHRRVHACRILNIQVRAVVMDRDDRSLIVAMLIENPARKDLSPVEKARAYQRILESQILDRTTLAEVLGVTERQILNIIMLNRLPDQILASLGDARTMALNVGMRLVAALGKSQQPPSKELLSQVAQRSGDATTRARFLIAETDRAARAAAIDRSLVITDNHGRRYARLTRSGSQLVLRFQPGLDPEILQVLAERIPSLYEEVARARNCP